MPLCGGMEVNFPRTVNVTDGHGIGIAFIARESENAGRAARENLLAFLFGQRLPLSSHFPKQLFSSYAAPRQIASDQSANIRQTAGTLSFSRRDTAEKSNAYVFFTPDALA